MTKTQPRRATRATAEIAGLFDSQSFIQKCSAVFTFAALAGLLYLLLPAGKPLIRQDWVPYVLLSLLVAFAVFQVAQQIVFNRLKGRWRRLEIQSMYDGLTQAFNRSAFEETLDEEMRRAGRYKFPLSICLIDLDNFKSFNDTYGHPRGDELLKKFSQHILKAIRSSDSLGRYGGDEFCILLPHTNLVNSEKFLARIQINVQEWLDTTFSAGLTSYRLGETMTEFLVRADLALYQAKREGKNRLRCLIGEDDNQVVVSF
ncbi:MAG: GGDEF domain-containing protein [Candidatus Omnitrophota bacterium]|nr:GGDEF domain-containing protein [Candidatus Omnitrophota bacterium]